MQLAGLAVQNFVSAAVGIAVAIALVRGFARPPIRHDRQLLGRLVRGRRLLLPLSIVAAVVLIVGGVVQNFNGFTEVATLTGGTQVLPGGPVASQEAIKELGTNGGGFFNANSAHPFENPTAWTNLFRSFLMLVIPVAMPRTFGTDRRRQPPGLRDPRRHGDDLHRLVVAVLTWLEARARAPHPQLAGGAMEGKEQRFGILGSTLFAAATTLTSTGAVNSMHDSYTPLGGMMPMINMMLGEIAPGGVGSGLYGMLVLAVIAVFVGGLLVGRTPGVPRQEDRPARDQAREPLHPRHADPRPRRNGAELRASRRSRRHRDRLDLEPGRARLSEVLYAFTSAANNNGSAFAGLTANTPWLNTALGVAMLLGRFIPIVLVLALAGSLAAQDVVPVDGRHAAHLPSAVRRAPLGVAVIITALTYFPVLTLGPLAEGLV